MLDFFSLLTIELRIVFLLAEALPKGELSCDDFLPLAPSEGGRKEILFHAFNSLLYLFV